MKSGEFCGIMVRALPCADDKDHVPLKKPARIQDPEPNPALPEEPARNSDQNGNPTPQDQPTRKPDQQPTTAPPDQPARSRDSIPTPDSSNEPGRSPGTTLDPTPPDENDTNLEKSRVKTWEIVCIAFGVLGALGTVAGAIATFRQSRVNGLPVSVPPPSSSSSSER